MPGVPGLQTETVGSQVPAQEFPLAATESGAGALDGVVGVPLVTTYWMLRPRTLLPLAFLAEAEKTWVAPMFMENVIEGLRVTLDTPVAARFPLLLPRQPERVEARMMANVRRNPERQRSINPLCQVSRFQGCKVSGTGLAGTLAGCLRPLKH